MLWIREKPGRLLVAILCLCTLAWARPAPASVPESNARTLASPTAGSEVQEEAKSGTSGGFRWRSATLAGGLYLAPLPALGVRTDFFVRANHLVGLELNFGSTMDDCQSTCNRASANASVYWGYLWGGRYGQVGVRAGLNYGARESNVDNRPATMYAWQDDTFFGPMVGVEATYTPVPAVGLGIETSMAPNMRFRETSWYDEYTSSSVGIGLQSVMMLALKFGADLTPR